jgi:flagellum-specific peptidoglycan hydrolase FlgJ
MPSASKPWWQQATALVSLGAGGAITGLSFVPQPAAELTSPTSMPIHLMALERSARQATASDATLRSAVVNVARYYLRMAEGKTPAEMQAMIWQQDSLDGVDHGASCAAFASMTLAMGAHAVGQESWVMGGATYPWPLHKWADVRVNPNPGSPGVTSIVQDAQAHHRWHALGDGYEPQPGDWVVFNGHVEVVTRYSGGALHTIGADSLPNFSVNAHEYPGPLGGQGVAAFVNNGGLAGPVHNTSARNAHAGGQPANGHKDTPTPGIPGTQAAGDGRRRLVRAPGGAAIPGASGLAPGHGKPRQQARRHAQQRPDRMSPGQRPVSGTGSGEAANAGGLWAQVPGPAAVPDGATADTAIIPGLPMMAHRLSARAAPSATPAGSHDASHPVPPAPEADPQQAFIGAIAPGAVAAQRKYGVPASVTIAQAIVESGWGESQLATQDHNLFGIKGTGPAGSDPQQTWEYVNGQQVTSTSQFRVYHNTAQSIDDHGRLLATSPYYRKPMADRRNPDAFAAALTGVYATDLDYGAKLISLMKRYDLYRYDALSPAPAPQSTTPQAPSPPSPSAQTPTPESPTAPAPAPQPSTPESPSAQPVSPQPSIPGAPSPKPPTPQASSPQAPTPRSPWPNVSSQQRASQQPPNPQPSIPQQAMIPGLANAPVSPTASAPSAARSRTASPGRGGPSEEDQRSLGAVPATQTVFASRLPASASAPARRDRSRAARRPASRYQQPLPVSVSNAFIAKARVRLMRAEPLYRDVADHNGIPWQLLAACDWMQCAARARYSPVHGEKLGGVNPDGTSYRTKSAALEQCADDLIELAGAVYGIELTAPGDLSIRDLANVFAAFRWGGLLRLHRTSAMEFPYSVASLTEQYSKMHWPNIDEPNTPDKPGGRFRMPFGAVPVVLSLNYPATV